MTLFDFDVTVKPHLHFIEAGANMAARHAVMLPCKPYFETFAEEELAKARAVLEAALQNIVEAQATYEHKVLELEYAQS